MALILSIETSAAICSTALHKDGELVSSLQINEPQAHAAKLAPLISDLFKGTDYKQNDLSAVAVSSGPGSFTGLRIGTSTAKGICFALNIPLIAITTLDLLASTARKHIHEEAFLCPMIDARRMEVYCQVFDRNLKVIEPISAKVLDETSFSELLHKGKVFFFGDGSGKSRQVINHQNAEFLVDIYPTASLLGEMASERFSQRAFEDLESFTPLYLKEFIAKKAQSFFN